MLSFMGNAIYKLLPLRYLKWKTNSINLDVHLLYCEKLYIVISLIIMYGLISYVFIYESWLRCTNIIDIINSNTFDNKNYKTSLFKRENTFCDTMDGFLIVYLFLLISTLAANIVIGILFDYYRKHKDTLLSKNKGNYDENIIIHIPIYNEDYDTIKSTIESVCNMNYDSENIIMIIVVDGIINNGNNCTTDYTLLYEILDNEDYKMDYNLNEVDRDSIKYKDNTLKIYTGSYKEIAYSVILKCGNVDEKTRKGNRGKKDSALIIYDTIYNMSRTQIEDVEKCYLDIIRALQSSLTFKSITAFDYMLIIDCDTDAEPNCLIQMVNYLKKNEKCVAVCGQTVVKNKNENYITIVQSFEYFISHLLLKTFESVSYNVLVLSGCFTLFRLKQDNKPTINKNIIDKYTKEAKGLYERNLLELGEDRFLTILIIQEYPEKYLSYISEAVSYTNVPNDFKTLLCQRRRWTNSLIVCLTLLALKPPVQSIYRHIKMYLVVIMELFIIFLLPLVIVIGLINSIISIAVQGYSIIPVIITSVIILLNLLISLSVLRLDMVFRFVPFFTYLPIFSIVIPIYSILNLDNLEWGKTREIQEMTDNYSEDLEIHTPKEEIVVMQEYNNM